MSDKKKWRLSFKVDSKFITQSLWLLMLLIACCAIWIDLQAYLKLSLETFGTNGGVLGFVKYIPVLGWLVNIVGVTVGSLLGIFACGTVQLLELYPLFIARDRRLAKTLIKAYNQEEKLEILETDSGSIKNLKDVYNKFPTIAYENAKNLQLFAYCVNLFVGCYSYPPARGNFFDFMSAIMLGQFNKIDYKNLIVLGISLFALEGIVRATFWLGEIKHYYKESRTNTEV